jgi:predicted nucleic acid-binding protein
VRTAVDTNVVSALWSGEPSATRMAGLLGESRRLGGLVICGAVYAELLAHPKASAEFVDEFLASTGIVVEFNTDEAVWRDAAAGFAGCARRRRRSAGTQPKRLLVDFVVGAHALSRADRLLSLDPSRYTKDFPSLVVIH